MTLTEVLARTTRIAAAIACGVVIVAAHAAAEPPSRELPAPTGKLPVGRVTHYWRDEARGELATEDPNDRRELRVDLWYPAERSPAAQLAPYAADLPALQKKMGMEAFLYSGIKTHTQTDAPIAQGTARYPLLIFSPGLGMNGFQYTSLAEELVSHGYIVATVDHPFQSKAIAYPDGRVVGVAAPSKEVLSDPERAMQDYRERVEVRSQDLRFVLDQLERLNASQGGAGQNGNSHAPARFAGRMDLSRVAALGHSIGGVAAPQACCDDARFKAAANLDGHARSLPFLLRDDGKGPRQPFIELTDGNQRPTDAELAKWKTSREDFDRQAATGAKRYHDAMRTIAGGSYRVTIPGVRHLSFGDGAMWDTDSLADRHRRIQIIRDYLRAFFDKVLFGKDQTLLDAAGPYVEVTVERYEPSE